MTITQVKTKAKKIGVKCGKMKKADIIHAIQEAEHNNPCFGSSNGDCSYTDCCFISDCLKVKN